MKLRLIPILLILLVPCVSTHDMSDMGCCTFPGTAESLLCTEQISYEVCCYSLDGTEIPGCSNHFYQNTECNEPITSCTNIECCCNTKTGKSSMISSDSCAYTIMPNEITLTCATSCQDAFDSYSQTNIADLFALNQGSISGSKCIYYYDGITLGTLDLGVIDIFPSISDDVTAAAYLEDTLVLVNTAGTVYTFDNNLNPIQQYTTSTLLGESYIDSLYIYMDGYDGIKYVYTKDSIINSDEYRNISIPDLFHSIIAPPDIDGVDAIGEFDGTLIVSRGSRLITIAGETVSEIDISVGYPFNSIDAMVRINDYLYIFSDC
jgi:hypothetical protein